MTVVVASDVRRHLRQAVSLGHIRDWWEGDEPDGHLVFVVAFEVGPDLKVQHWRDLAALDRLIRDRIAQAARR